MSVQGYNLTATVYSATGEQTLDKILTALAQAGMVAEDAALTNRKPAWNEACFLRFVNGTRS